MPTWRVRSEGGPLHKNVSLPYQTLLESIGFHPKRNEFSRKKEKKRIKKLTLRQQPGRGQGLWDSPRKIAGMFEHIPPDLHLSRHTRNKRRHNGYPGPPPGRGGRRRRRGGGGRGLRLARPGPLPRVLHPGQPDDATGRAGVAGVGGGGRAALSRWCSLSWARGNQSQHISMAPVMNHLAGCSPVVTPNFGATKGGWESLGMAVDNMENCQFPYLSLLG